MAQKHKHVYYLRFPVPLSGDEKLPEAKGLDEESKREATKDAEADLQVPRELQERAAVPINLALLQYLREMAEEARNDA